MRAWPLLIVLLAPAACGEGGGDALFEAGSAGGATVPGAPGHGGAAAGGAGAAPRFSPPEPAGCVTTVEPGVHVLPCEGMGFDLSVPEACVAQSCGLVLDVHGGTMSARMQDKNTDMKELGRRHGYVVVQPSAINGLFAAAVDDGRVIGFVRQVMAALRIDPKRVHATGFSQGGYMTWRFACDHAGLFASFAPAAAAEGGAVLSPEVGCNFPPARVPAEAVRILYMHGTQDALVPFPSAVAQRDAVVAGLGLGPAESLGGGSHHRRTRHVGASGSVLEFLEHDYVTDASFGIALLGHCYPGSPDRIPTEPGQLMGFGCIGPNAFHWGEEAMRFFIANPKP